MTTYSGTSYAAGAIFAEEGVEGFAHRLPGEQKEEGGPPGPSSSELPYQHGFLSGWRGRGMPRPVVHRAGPIAHEI